MSYPDQQSNQERSSKLATFLKLAASGLLLVSSIATYRANRAVLSTPNYLDFRRHLSSVSNIPSYMTDLMNDLDARKRLFDETPPEEVKYWFEYTGPLQVSKNIEIEAFLLKPLCGFCTLARYLQCISFFRILF
jgi:hypothetical protein